VAQKNTIVTKQFLLFDKNIYAEMFRTQKSNVKTNFLIY